jgi:hypothetical protein
MTEPARKQNALDPAADAQARREGIRRRLAEQGIFVQLPATGSEWMPEHPLPFPADELSEMVVRLRRGEV